jgi:biotin carboxyl carrier protein
MIYEVTIAGETRGVEIRREGDHWLCRTEGQELAVSISQPRPEILVLLIDGKVYELRLDRTAQGAQLWIGGSVHFPVEVRDPRSLKARRAAAYAAEGPEKVIASMPGKVVRVLRSANDPVEAGEGILVVEAMKMQNEVKSPKKGVIRQVLAKEGGAVNAGDVLAIVE